MCSEQKINYWLKKYKIRKRTISEAIYQFKNPKGDPFKIKVPTGLTDGILYGLGLGLYWGEGEKRGGSSLRLANTDFRLINKYILFLENICGIKKTSLRFGLHIFNDVDSEKALFHWMKNLKIKRNQFYKVQITKSRGSGTYRYKSEYGVIIVYFNNTKLKKAIIDLIDNL